MKAPPRLIDDPAVAPELREDLERARRAGPPYDVAVGLAGFQAVLGAGAGAGTTASTTTTTTASTTSAGAGATSATAKVAGVLSVKTVVATVVATAAVATAIAWPSAKPAPARTPPEHPTAVAPHAAAPAAAPAPEIPAAPAAPVDAPAVPPAVQVAPTPASVVSARAGEKRNAARSDDADSRHEIAQLARIKAMVDVDPARAYRLAQQGDREFARGMLRQERDALAIVALAHSERSAEAKQHLRAFIARYPNSPAREHLTQLLGAERE